MGHYKKRRKAPSIAAVNAIYNREVVTVAEAAQLACVTPDTIRSHVESGKILACRSGYLLLVSFPSLREYYPHVGDELPAPVFYACG